MSPQKKTQTSKYSNKDIINHSSLMSSNHEIFALQVALSHLLYEFLTVHIY